MNIGFTGTQRYQTGGQKNALGKFLYYHFCKYHNAEFHHGMCIGADHDAHKIAHRLGYEIIFHPPLSKFKVADIKCVSLMKLENMRDPKEYLERNHDIVDETDILIATPNGFLEEQRSGTWSTVRYARKQGKHIYIIYPDSSIEEENGKI